MPAYSQRDICVAERLNVSRPVITRLETGVQEPALSYLLSLSKAFNISIDELIGRKPQTNDYLFEVFGDYSEEPSLPHVIDYLIKNPKMIV
ncbi:hypothetical protein WQ54_25660 [Bacillus sp. SA1-12]|uniref:helix-turn-helix domain-containing protein n=1 Tax=Bacillus sp. SA1-12 TaxID=1455638 RepID=UPI000627161D|nr:hypothetical protein WQ54_25660 [Bacillus sp. SA1-12]